MDTHGTAVILPANPDLARARAYAQALAATANMTDIGQAIAASEAVTRQYNVAVAQHVDLDDHAFIIDAVDDLEALLTDVAAGDLTDPDSYDEAAWGRLLNVAGHRLLVLAPNTGADDTLTPAVDLGIAAAAGIIEVHDIT